MQPIILLGVAVAAVALVSTGFLAGEPWNEFELFVQQLGWGEGMVSSPVSNASVDLEIKKKLNDNGTPGTGPEAADDYYDNVISDCSFHSATTIAPVTGSGARDGKIICKILDENLNAMAEGHIPIPAATGYVGSTTPAILIPINMCAELGAGLNPDCLDVQAPIHAVKVVVEAPIGQN